MVKHFLFLFVYCFSFAAAEAQYAVFTRANNGTNNITIPAGEIWQIHSWVGTTDYSVLFFRIKAGEASETITWLWGTSGEVISTDKGFIPDSQTRYLPVGMLLPGPCTFEYNSSGQQSPLQNHPYSLGFKKLSSLTSQPNISASSVVIPTSSSGDVDVKMEQSADNVTWTECLPGTYNSSTVKRFFRLRAVEK